MTPMPQQIYQLVVSGKTVQGMAPAQVAGNLARGFKFDKTQILQVLGGKPRVIKTSPDLEAIKRLGEKLHAAGVVCQIKRASQPSANSATAPKPKPQPSQAKASTPRIMNIPPPPAPDAKHPSTAQMQAQALASIGKPGVALRMSLTEFNPKWFSKSAQQIIVDEAGNQRFEIERTGFYYGWLLLVPVLGLVAALISIPVARNLATLIDNSYVVYAITAIELIALWIVATLYSRPLSEIDIVDIVRNQEISVLQQNEKLFFRHKGFFLATDAEATNASINYDQLKDQCECESLDGSLYYIASHKNTEKDSILNVISSLMHYFKEIPLRLFAAKKNIGARKYTIYDKSNRAIAHFSLGNDLTLTPVQAHVSLQHLIAMAMVCAGA